MNLKQYLKIWVASMRYSIVRTMMFRFDFLVWLAVDFVWMMVNILLIEVIFSHVDNLAGWGKYEMLVLIGTAMIISRIFDFFFMGNLLELGGKIRLGEFDFTIIQPGNPLFMVSTRKVDLEGLPNAFVGLGVVIYSMGKLGLEPHVGQIFLYALMLICGILVHFGVLLTIASASFWIVSTEGTENGYFNLFQFSRLPRSAFKGVFNFLLVYFLPVVIISNLPARTLIDGINWIHMLWLTTATGLWFFFACSLFSYGSRRYTSASS